MLKKLVFTGPLWLVRLLAPLIRRICVEEVFWSDGPLQTVTPDHVRALANSADPAVIEYIRQFEGDQNAA
jgi:hypothetical protein